MTRQWKKFCHPRATKLLEDEKYQREVFQALLLEQDRQDAGDNRPDGDDSERVGGSYHSGDEKERYEGDNGRNKCNRKEAIKLFPSKEQ